MKFGDDIAQELGWMQRAWDLARLSVGHTRPNPPVGAVVIKDGVIIGEGRHRVCGGDHAEVAALKDAEKRLGYLPVGATVFCTLEPCSKPGRVGACCDALIAAKVARVVWACGDPNPKNANAAMAVLAAAGIDCACWAQSQVASKRKMAEDIESTTLRSFAKHVLTGLPFVRVKLAMSLDGKICDNSGYAKWISSAASREKTGSWRESADVVMVGAETVRRDNPSLLCHTQDNPDLWRVVVSGSGVLPRDAQIFQDQAKDRTLVYRDAVEAVHDLGRRGFMEVLCEGGLGLARSLASAGLVDEWINVMAPVVIGDKPLSQAFRFDGDDVFVSFQKGDLWQP